MRARAAADILIFRKGTAFCRALFARRFRRVAERADLCYNAERNPEKKTSGVSDMQEDVLNGLTRGELRMEGESLVYRVVDCRVQTARRRKGMALHPCRSAGIVEYASFAAEIDSRIRCTCESCYPEVSDETCCCAWRFTLAEDTP